MTEKLERQLERAAKKHKDTDFALSSLLSEAATALGIARAKEEVTAKRIERKQQAIEGFLSALGMLEREQSYMVRLGSGDMVKRTP